MAEGTVTTRPRARSFIIKRPRLTKLLDESEARILLLVAPAGYGKTTLAREWLEGKSGVAWYSGSPSMGDVAALAAEVAEALAPADNDLAERVRNLAAQSQSPELLARAVAASDAAKRCGVLAIDDCHHATGSDAANAFLNELISRTEFRVVGTSRVRPAWVTPRMLVYGEAAMLETDDLAFTDEEAREVLGSGNETNAELLDTAQGWPAVIGLAAIGEGRRSPEPGVQPSNLYEFFAEDLFEAASPILRAGLFLLALGADASVDIARSLLGADCDAVLEEAVEQGFLTGSSNAPSLHPLLRGFVVNKLMQLPPEDRESLVRTAGSTLADHRSWDEYLSTLEAFPIPDLVTSALERALNELLATGRLATARRWVELARSQGVDEPVLLLAEAELAFREGEDGAAQVLGERAGELLGVGDPAARAYLVAGRAAHLRDEREAARDLCARAEQLATSDETRLEALWAQFTIAIEENGSDLAETVRRMRTLKKLRPDDALRIQQAEGLLLFYAKGDARAAGERFALASELLPSVSDPVLRTSFLNLYSYAMLVLAQYEEALELADRQITEARSHGVEFAVDHGLLRRASALIGLRRLREAKRTIAELDHRSSAAPRYILRNTNLQAARLRVTLGDLDRAEILLRRRIGQSHGDWPELLAYRGLVLTALGQLREGERLLLAAKRDADSFDAIAITELGFAVVALQSHSSDGELLAKAALARAIARGRLDALVTACRVFPDLARVGASDPSLSQPLAELFICSRDIDLARRAGFEMPREFRRSEGLSPREREVYELLVQGLTNADIARTLFISESTTKVHVRHIYEKLGVHTRAEAASATLSRS